MRPKPGPVDRAGPNHGVRRRHQLAPGQELTLRGDVGGFGTGCDFTWQLIGPLDWQMCTSGGLARAGGFGYRAQSADCEQGPGGTTGEYGVPQHDPAMGLSPRF